MIKYIVNPVERLKEIEKNDHLKALYNPKLQWYPK